MIRKVKIWHTIIVFSVIIIFFRFTDIINSLVLFAAYVRLFIHDSFVAFNQLDFALFDQFVSCFFIVLIPVFVIWKGNKIKALQRRINFPVLMLVVLLFVFLFAPLISDTNPKVQINTARLLPPLSSIYEIKLSYTKTFEDDILGSFLKIKENAIKSPISENTIFADRIELQEDYLIYFQNNERETISKDKILFSEGEPIIEKNIFILGTDQFGRDIYSRLVYGARISLFVGFGAVVISFIVGISLGFFAGYPGKIADSILSRFTDMFLAFPIIFLIILILALFGSSLLTVIFVLGVSGWMSLFKIIRGEVISLKNKDFFISAQMIGLSKKNLLLKEILPVVLAPVIVNLVFLFGNVILAESALSYLGLGVGENYPSWGSMINSGQAYLLEAWWMIFSPGLALFLTIFTAYDLGREINAELNPALKK